MKLATITIVALVFCTACGNQVRDKRNNSSPNNENNASNDPNNTSGTNNAPNNESNNPNNGSNNSINNPANNPPNNITPPNNVNNPPNNANNPPNNVNNPPNNTECVWDDTFFGQIGGTDEHGGGVPTPAALTGQAGLSDVLFEMPPTPDDFNTVEDEGYVVLDFPIDVNGATVTATGPGFAGNRRFFVEDADGAVQVFLAAELPFTIRVGDQVAFTATALQNFEGHPQIAEVTNFTILSSGNAVPYRDVNNRALSSNDYSRVIRLAGTVGASYDCGGTNCYDFVYPGGTATLRSRSTIVMRGSCIQYAGPMYSFPGPLQNGMTPNLQLDTINFDWMWIE